MALGPVRGAGILTFFCFFQNVPKCPKKGPGGPGEPWGLLGSPGGPYFPYFSFIFPLFSPPPLGAPYFSFYTAVISPPISPLKAAALWGAPPVHFTLVCDGQRCSRCDSTGVTCLVATLLSYCIWLCRGHCLTRAAAFKGLIGGDITAV